jgi:Protein of unknown function (DUF2510)
VFNLSTGQLIFYGLLSIVWAFLGYRLSENDRRVLGRTPWGLPSMLWAFFWFLSLLLGLVLYLIAHSSGVRQARQNPHFPGVPGPGTGPPVLPPSGRPPTASELFPAYPRPANAVGGEGEMPAEGQGDGTEGSAESGNAGVQQEWTNSPPAWHPDPSGRFHWRWWDGTQWTSQVAIDGQHLIDTNPDQRIGPY